MILRFILFSILFYFIFKIARFIMRLMFAPTEQKKENITQKEPKKKFDIDSNDIVEADFEEIKNDEPNSK